MKNEYFDENEYRKWWEDIFTMFDNLKECVFNLDDSEAWDLRRAEIRTIAVGLLNAMISEHNKNLFSVFGNKTRLKEWNKTIKRITIRICSDLKKISKEEKKFRK